jgi:hypothetical protein
MYCTGTSAINGSLKGRRTEYDVRIDGRLRRRQTSGCRLSMLQLAHFSLRKRIALFVRLTHRSHDVGHHKIRVFQGILRNLVISVTQSTTLSLDSRGRVPLQQKEVRYLTFIPPIELFITNLTSDRAPALPSRHRRMCIRTAAEPQSGRGRYQYSQVHRRSDRPVLGGSHIRG